MFACSEFWEREREGKEGTTAIVDFRAHKKLGEGFQMGRLRIFALILVFIYSADSLGGFTKDFYVYYDVNMYDLGRLVELGPASGCENMLTISSHVVLF